MAIITDALTERIKGKEIEFVYFRELDDPYDRSRGRLVFEFADQTSLWIDAAYDNYWFDDSHDPIEFVEREGDGIYSVYNSRREAICEFHCDDRIVQVSGDF